VERKDADSFQKSKVDVDQGHGNGPKCTPKTGDEKVIEILWLDIHLNKFSK
jgi:hypothetical protein